MFQCYKELVFDPPPILTCLHIHLYPVYSTKLVLGSESKGVLDTDTGQNCAVLGVAGPP